MIDTTKLPDSLSEVFTFTSIAKLKGKEGTIERQKYNNAKGNNEMDRTISEQQRTRDARDIVLPLIKDEKIAAIKAQLDIKKPIYVLPVQQKESVSNNLIPRQYADILANKLNGRKLYEIYRRQGTHNTGADTKSRLANKITFAGAVPTDGQIIIIDDTFVSGTTILALMEHVKNKGGKTKLVSTIAASKYGKGLKQTQDKIKELINDVKLPTKEIERIIGTPLRGLTNAQINSIRLSTRKGGKKRLKEHFGSSILDRPKQKGCNSNERNRARASKSLAATGSLKQIPTSSAAKPKSKTTAKQRLQERRAKKSKWRSK